jgi:hypothetical protein
MGMYWGRAWVTREVLEVVLGVVEVVVGSTQGRAFIIRPRRAVCPSLIWTISRCPAQTGASERVLDGEMQDEGQGGTRRAEEARRGVKSEA